MKQSNCAAKVEVVMGDARLSMARELPQHFDLLALDAFSGDAIPVHLLTVEAFRLYFRHLKPSGVVMGGVPYGRPYQSPFAVR